MKPFILMLLKIAISLVLILVLFRNLALRPVWEAIRSAQLNWLLAAFSLNALGYLISAFRWQILLAAQDIHLSLWKFDPLLSGGFVFQQFSPLHRGRGYGSGHGYFPGQSVLNQIPGHYPGGTIHRGLGLAGFRTAGGPLGKLFRGRAPVAWVGRGILWGLLLALWGAWQWLKTKEPRGPGFFLKLREKIMLFHETIFYYKSRKLFFVKALGLAFLLQLNSLYSFI